MEGMKELIKKCGYNVPDEDRKYKKSSSYKQNRGSQGERQKAPFWEEYLVEGNKYFLDQKEEKKKMNPNYVDSYAQALAKKFKQGSVKITQIRGFYNTVVKLNRKMNGNLMEAIDFDEIQSDLKILKSFANNKNENGYVTKDFVDFIERNVNSVHDKKDLKAFKMHFEAIIGYMPKDR